ncbi:MAG: Asp-tRNA(Asn)/Glu-tRNA(Gln) amidotransferase subunit GatB [Deltaproteobacteria bacterium]|jgi:aspartyl-tRNA(Asn)/glutamyl-tRNA(Gln) amidotransferase subunit B|nr:Asp-tRNA(Asn)/Glu-tRNA(Gln) amidotransferase subunit GatB [Deltaproteobacteria bacterium]
MRITKKWETVIGLEVHVQLKTETKLFCSCPNKFGAEPNAHVCPGCAGMPGALPVLNARAVELAVRAGLALNCRINLESVFARKSYFYPDLPAGFQTSQLEPPICAAGSFEGIRINRIHLEDDAGKCVHAGNGETLVDLNRAGTPLIEIVTEPDFRSPAQAAEFMRRLRYLLVYMGVTDANMEEGGMRCDVNVSLRPSGSEAYGTRTELKNLNSFNNIEDAAECEAERHREVLEAGGVLVQETRQFDPENGITRALRSKEEATDYRYFPNPDLPAVRISREFVEAVAAAMPEQPEARAKRYLDDLGLHQEEVAILAASAELGDYFEAALALQNSPKRLAGLILGELLPECNRRGLGIAEVTGKAGHAGQGEPVAPVFTAERLAHTAAVIESGKVSLKVAHELFADLLDSGEALEKLAEQRGLLQVSDSSALEGAVLEAIAANPEEAAAYRGGKSKLLSFFVGQVMRRTKGAGNPALINELLKKHLQ